MTVAIFFLAGLQLRRGEAVTALAARDCVAWGMASILLATPLLAAPVLKALPLPPELGPLVTGTAVFCCMPTTLSSGISMTAAVGGNTALALLLTVGSNLLSVATLPWLLPALLGSGGAAGSGLQPAALLAQLCSAVLAPTLAGAAARAYIPGVAAAVDGSRRVIAWASASCLAMVPWMQVSAALAGGLTVPPTHLAVAAGLGIAVHAAFLALNVVAAVVLNLGGAQPPPERARLRQALVLQASQKTLPVAVAVLSDPTGLAAQLGPLRAGLAALSAVMAHLMQVLVDSALVPAWRGYIERAGSAGADASSPGSQGAPEKSGSAATSADDTPPAASSAASSACAVVAAAASPGNNDARQQV